MERIKQFLKEHNYVVIEDSPITMDNEDVFELEGNLILKITKNFFEIKAANTMVGQLSDNIADIISVDKVKTYHIIILEKLEPLTEELCKSHAKFEKTFKRFFLYFVLIKSITFGKVNPKFGRFKRLLSANTIKWLTLAKEMKVDAKRMGIEHPSDYLSINNIGLKSNGVVACYDMRDVEDDIFYERI